MIAYARTCEDPGRRCLDKGGPGEYVRRVRIFCFLFVLLALVLGRAEGGDVASGVLAEGTRWETPYYVIDSGVEGGTVFLTGGLHGNEPAGARAAEEIRQWPIVKGKLVVVPRANVQGLIENLRYLPGELGDTRDLNRNFPLGEKEGEVARGEPAISIWALAREVEPDWVVDLHEGFDFRVSHEPKEGKKPSVGSRVIYFESEVMDGHAEAMLAAANALVDRPERLFVPLTRGAVAGSLARAGAKVMPGGVGFILETTYEDQPMSVRTKQHRAMMNVFLNRIGMIETDCSDRMTGAGGEGPVKVAFFDGAGTGPTGNANIPRILDEAPDAEVHFVGARDMRPEVLRQFDVVFFPGGSGSKQAADMGEQNREHLRAFVERGGGYVGVCAGAFLCSAHYSWSLGLGDASVFTGSREIPGVGKKQMWYRGKGGDVEVDLTEEGAEIFDEVPESFTVRYHNGPIISPGQRAELADFVPLAYFRSEEVLYEPQRGTMVNTPAIVAGTFGEGRVISISPHPESSKALEPVITDAVRWVAAEGRR